MKSTCRGHEKWILSCMKTLQDWRSRKL
jgi:hypothetical protein